MEMMMNKQIVLINSQAERQLVEINKYLFQYDNDTGFSLEFGNAWNHEEILLRAFSVEGDSNKNELNVSLLVRPFSADTVYVKPLGLQQDPELLVREVAKPRQLPKVMVVAANSQQHAIEVAQIVCVYENGLAITVNIPQSEFPKLAMEEIGIEVRVLPTAESSAQKMARISFELSAANLITLKPQVWEPKFACHTGKCNYN